jgi:hypothetical protein
MDTTASKQVEVARALGAKIQFVLDPATGALPTLHSCSELCDALVSTARQGYVQVYDARDPQRLVTEPMAHPRGDTLTVLLVQRAIDRALAKFTLGASPS